MGKKTSAEQWKKWLTGLVEKLGKEELGFSDERRATMFKLADKDADGSVSAADFKTIFVTKQKCTLAITLTENYDIADGKTIAKVEPGAFVELHGDSKKDESSGMVRSECTL